LSDFTKHDQFKKSVEYWLKNEAPVSGCQLSAIKYKLDKGRKRCKGTYLHKDLIHLVAEWVSMEYSFKVKHIMDAINEGDTDKLQKEIEKLKEKCNLLSTTNEVLEKEIVNKSVRVDTAEKKLHIVKNKKKMYKLSANSTDTSESKLGGETVESYIFPASLNVRQEVSKKLKKNLFSSDELPRIKELIINLKPKVVNESNPKWMKNDDVVIGEITINEDEIDDDDDDEEK
jgi:septal ring factor EnvC (AmiA/AmiB activator)